MKDITVVLPQEVEQIKIIILGDVHCGSPQFNEKLFLDTINKIKTNDDYYAILLGDLIDNTIKQSKGNIYLNTESPQESMKRMLKYLMPIRHKILVGCPGNHEERSEKEVGVDLMYWLCKSLGLIDEERDIDRYSDGPFCLFIKMGSSRKRKNVYHTFSIFGSHGSSSGITHASAVNKLIGMTNLIPNADIYIMGHTHKPIITWDKRYLINNSACRHVEHESLLVNGSSFLDFEGSYGEKKLYKPTSQKIPLIILKTGYNSKEVSVGVS